MTPAGFWRRWAAWSLDWLLLSPLLALLLASPLARAWRHWLALNAQLDDWVYARIVAADGAFPSPLAMTFELMQDRALAATLQLGVGRLYLALAQALALALVLGAAYFIAFEASAWQATPGKRLLRLRVQMLDGARANPARVTVRHGSGALSWLALNLGHAIAGWRADRRALHDLIAGMQVVAEGEMPRWARAWLALQFGLLAALLLALLARLAWLLWQLATL